MTGLHCCSRQLFVKRRLVIMKRFVRYQAVVASIKLLTKEDVKDEAAVLQYIRPWNQSQLMPPQVMPLSYPVG